MCRFSRAWTAGGGVDKTPCLWWGRGGREDGGKGKTGDRNAGEKGERGGEGREEAGERTEGRSGVWEGAVGRVQH